MLVWITENIGTILISLGLILMVTGIIVKLIRDKKRGKSCCGSSCSHCGACSSCNQSGNH